MHDFKSFKNELQNILNGTVNQSQSHSIQAAKAYLRNCAKSGRKVEGSKFSRAEKERALKEYLPNKIF